MIGNTKVKGLMITSSIILLLLLSMMPSAQSYTIHEYELLDAAEYGLNPRPLNLIISRDETTLYFTEEFSEKIGMIDITLMETSTLVPITEYTIPFDPIEGFAEPWDLCEDPDNPVNIYYTDYHLGRIGRLDTSGPQIVWWKLPIPGGGPRGIFCVSGSEIWVAEFLGDRIVRFNPGSPSTMTLYPLPTGSQPNEILVHGNNVIFTEYGRSRIGVFTKTGTGTIILKEYPLPSNSRPWDLAVDPRGMVWFTASGRSEGVIGELNLISGEVIEHKSFPTSNSEPRGIAVDNSTGDVWFTEFSGHKIGRYAPSDNIFFEYPTLSLSSSPADLAVQRSDTEPGGSVTFDTAQVYFTMWSANKIGRLFLGGLPPDFGTTTTITASKITTAVTGRFYAATKNTTTTVTSPSAVSVSSTTVPSILSFTTSKTGTTKTDTAFQRSTSTKGTSTSFIVQAEQTTSTFTSTSTSFVSTESLTSTNVSVSVSTSFIDTTSYTTTSTSFFEIFTSTQSLTSSSTISVNDTLLTTLTQTSYKSTTSATTTVTSTTTIQALQTQTATERQTITTFTTTTPTATPANITLPTPCIIATAAYESPLSPFVQYLREFRDNLVMKTFAGSNFMNVFNTWYYSFSPSFASHIAASPTLKLATRLFIYPLIGILHLASAVFFTFSGINREMAVILSGVVSSSLIGLVYDAPLAFGVLYALKRKYGLFLSKTHSKMILYVLLGSFIFTISSIVISNPLLTMISTSVLVLSLMMFTALLTSNLILQKFLKK